MEIDSPEELINRRRHQILVHSYLYYRLNTNLISDYMFDEWAKELVRLQNNNVELSGRGIYAEYFRGFDGASGFDLPHHLPEVAIRAERLMKSVKVINRK